MTMARPYRRARSDDVISALSRGTELVCHFRTAPDALVPGMAAPGFRLSDGEGTGLGRHPIVSWWT
jgi:hypothetical protein